MTSGYQLGHVVLFSHTWFSLGSYCTPQLPTFYTLLFILLCLSATQSSSISSVQILYLELSKPRSPSLSLLISSSIQNLCHTFTPTILSHLVSLVNCFISTGHISPRILQLICGQYVPFILSLLYSTKLSAEHTVGSIKYLSICINFTFLDTLHYVTGEVRLPFTNEDYTANKEQRDVILFFQGPIFLLLDERTLSSRIS